MIKCAEVKEKVGIQIEETVQEILKDLTIRFEKRLKQTVASKETTMLFVVGNSSYEIAEKFLQLLIENGYIVFTEKLKNGDMLLKISGWIL